MTCSINYYHQHQSPLLGYSGLKFNHAIREHTNRTMSYKNENSTLLVSLEGD